jgi:hypothetical protein
VSETPPDSADQRRPTAGWRRISITIAAVAVIAGVSYGIGWRAGHEEDPATFTLTRTLSRTAEGAVSRPNELGVRAKTCTPTSLGQTHRPRQLKSSSYTEQTNTVDLGGAGELPSW